MRERVFGIETEYAVVYHPSRGERVDGTRPTNLQIFQWLEPLLVREVRSLPRAFSLLRSKPGKFLENGASFHYEATPYAFEHGLLELASPECRDPFTLLACERAKDALVEDLALRVGRQLASFGFEGEARIGKNNVDVLGHTFGSHESYQVHDPLAWPAKLALAPLWLALWALTLPALLWLVAASLALIVLGLSLGLLPLLAGLGGALAAGVRRLAPRAGAALARGMSRLLRGPERLAHLLLNDPAALVRHLAWVDFPLRPVIALHAWVYARFHFVPIRRKATAFLVTRSVFAGAGRVVMDGGPLLRVSQRAPFMKSLARIFTTGENRPLFELRDAFVRPWSAFGPRRRLHLLHGDANLCDWALVLRAGATALVLEAIEQRPDAEWPELARPLEALRAVADDPALERELELRDGSFASALEVQWRALALVRRALADDPAPVLWKARVVAMWGETLELLARDPAALADRVDWLAKRKLLEREVPEPADRARLAAEGAALMAAERGGPGERLRRLAWRALRVDFAYHELGARGAHRRLEAEGAVRRLASDAEVARARRDPPADTRAAARSRAIRDADARGVSGGVTWHRARVGLFGWRFFTDPLSPNDTWPRHEGDVPFPSRTPRK
jgi:Pup amidohydrolase